MPEWFRAIVLERMPARMSLIRDYAASLASQPLSISGNESGELRFDEVVAPDGTLRPSWKAMAEVAFDLTAEELHRIEDEISSLLADDGVTYEHPDAGSLPWNLDPMPLVLDAATWSRLEVGLAQRAELLSALLSDIYGEQRMLSEGVIPSPVVFGHSGFLRPLVRPESPDPHPLIISGADLGRDAEGEWRVLADRVQAPSGLGFAMENRRVISRVLPDLYREAGLHRMEPYFSALRSTLLQAAPADVADPRVVVLSPGTHSETAYDQAFLANVMGFPLVQGSDLIVRDGWVWMKPAGYPRRAPEERVDVILRRVDAEWCDPLQLRSGSQLGVAGLVEVVARGRVQLVNGLGAGVLENPALMPFLPAVSERLLGEQLRLPSVDAWWCGEPEGLERTLADAGSPSLSIRELDGRTATLAGASADELRAMILAAPHRFVARGRLPLSQIPAWSSAEKAGGLAVPRQVMLRSFTIRDGSVYRPLIGGLATLAADAGEVPVTKDVWVLKGAPEDPDQGLEIAPPRELAIATPMLAPRALEDMFWAGRYAERAEDMLRLVITTRAYAEELDYSTSAAGGRAVHALHAAIEALAGRDSQYSAEELRALLLDRKRPGSAAHSFEGLRDALEGVRDQLSGDTWRVFGAVDRAARTLRGSRHAQQIPDVAGRMLTGILSLQGVTANMVRDPGWRMIEIGRFVERALQVVSLLAATAVATGDADTERAVFEGTLRAAESSVTHRRRNRGVVRVAGAVELLITDAENPRSIAFALAAVREHVAALPASTGSSRPERLLEDLENEVAEADVALLSQQIDGERAALSDFLESAGVQLRQLSDAIAQLHFESDPLPQPISSLSLIEERMVRL
ncbi:putative circularly permuted ATP-grasp superfamily protein/putative alpha-E superfamily protein [Microbacterium endophyticum]|uniref:Putative circularly permuted ATP-grasp superfamily protein/putative alpha-E superfamily protein n=1 Tax=Microbacterium endophyticum TaxID=1526412 RepID=A0A7W4YM80_9MICO|nr:circularly permuted type 2 ATP-grasp protein [Microbacterium endophyticum]MBB2975923.1 putative circularly permuted ATP-grasp superfamily protein/putative alpha-E superfamily protein [Microbacterium endophyticum]NIK37708.1 putative circularly permuted ATP-grasp superfamily protein/putative alpha-E superfamily protein [Microbacterium endophyticum]